MCNSVFVGPHKYIDGNIVFLGRLILKHNKQHYIPCFCLLVNGTHNLLTLQSKRVQKYDFDNFEEKKTEFALHPYMRRLQLAPTCSIIQQTTN